jgi:hypothetical protein
VTAALITGRGDFAAGAIVAVVGLVALFVVNLIAPWPWQQGWRD